MEIALFWFIIWLATKDFVADLPFSLRGKVSPHHQYRMEKLRQRAGNGGRPVPRTGAGRYFSGVINDAIGQAHEKRSAKHQVKRPYKVRNAEAKTRTKMDRKEAKRTGKTGPADPSGPEDAETAPDAEDQGTATARTADQRPTPIVVPHRDLVPDPVDASDPALGPGVEAQAPVVEAGPPSTPAPAGVPDLAGMEGNSLDSAISFVELIDTTIRVAMTMVHQVALSVEGADVDHTVVDWLAEAYEKLDAALADLDGAQKELESRLPTKDLSSKVEGSVGDEEWVTGHTKPSSESSAA